MAMLQRTGTIRLYFPTASYKHALLLLPDHFSSLCTHLFVHYLWDKNGSKISHKGALNSWVFIKPFETCIWKHTHEVYSILFSKPFGRTDFLLPLLLRLYFGCFANGPQQTQTVLGSHMYQERHLNTGHFSVATKSSPFLDASYYCHGARCLMLLL